MIEYAKVIGDNAKLRNGAGTSFCMLAIIPDGSIVAVTEYTNDEWCKVVYNSYTGYMMRKYLIGIDEEENITITISKECAKELCAAINRALMN